MFERTRTSALIFATIACVLFAARSATAHLAATNFGVVVYDDRNEPLVLATSYGLITRETAGEPWRYVCPAAHGGPDAPAAAGTSEGRAWIVTNAGALLITPNGAPVNDKLSEVESSQLPQLVAILGDVYALTREDVGSRIYRLEVNGVAPLRITDVWWQSIAAVDGDLLLARTSTSGTAFLTLSTEGTVTATASHPARGYDVSIFAPHPDHVYAVTRDETTSHLLRLEDGVPSLVLETPFMIQGVTVADGTTFVAIDNRLHRLDGDVAIAVEGEKSYVTCLRNGPAGPYLCARTDLYPLTAAGVVGEPWFRIATILEPNVPGLDERQAIRCEFEWRDLASEVIPNVPTPAPAPEPGGCAAVHGARQPSYFALFVLLLLTGVARGCLRGSGTRDGTG